MQKTSNYRLSQYGADDRVTREAVNADNRVIDAALAGVAAVAAAAGNCRIETGTYEGTGNNSLILPLDREPLLLLITMINYENTGAIPSLILAAGRGCTYANTSVATSLPQNAHVQCRWTDKGMYFHCYSHPEGCGNKQNTTYRYFAFYDDET